VIRQKQFAGWIQNAGRLQVWRKGEWGGVCRDNFDNRDARVACRELGFSWGNVTTSEDAKTAIGGGRIWLTKVECSGDEKSLSSCQNGYSVFGDDDCGNTGEAFVRCGYM